MEPRRRGSRPSRRVDGARHRADDARDGRLDHAPTPRRALLQEAPPPLLVRRRLRRVRGRLDRGRAAPRRPLLARRPPPRLGVGEGDRWSPRRSPRGGGRAGKHPLLPLRAHGDDGRAAGGPRRRLDAVARERGAPAGLGRRRTRIPGEGPAGSPPPGRGRGARAPPHPTRPRAGEALRPERNPRLPARRGPLAHRDDRTTRHGVRPDVLRRGGAPRVRDGRGPPVDVPLAVPPNPSLLVHGLRPGPLRRRTGRVALPLVEPPRRPRARGGDAPRLPPRLPEGGSLLPPDRPSGLGPRRRPPRGFAGGRADPIAAGGTLGPRPPRSRRSRRRRLGEPRIGRGTRPRGDGAPPRGSRGRHARVPRGEVLPDGPRSRRIARRARGGRRRGSLRGGGPRSDPAGRGGADVGGPRGGAVRRGDRDPRGEAPDRAPARRRSGRQRCKGGGLARAAGPARGPPLPLDVGGAPPRSPRWRSRPPRGLESSPRLVAVAGRTGPRRRAPGSRGGDRPRGSGDGSRAAVEAPPSRPLCFRGALEPG